MKEDVSSFWNDEEVKALIEINLVATHNNNKVYLVSKISHWDSITQLIDVTLRIIC